MIKRTPELIAQRREEIINACEELYRTMSFKEITLKEIGKITSFSRPTIYNYFETKEEIFLALFQREYECWNDELTSILEGNEQLTKAELSAKIAASLAGRAAMTKLPKIALGAWAWGNDGTFGNNLTAENLKPIFDTAMENGLNLWDTAYAYGMGTSEKVLAGFLKAMG